MILAEGRAPVICMDCAGVVKPEHAGQALATGSHGALIGVGPAAALRTDAHAALYNDAGITRLPALDTRAIAAGSLGRSLRNTPQVRWRTLTCAK